LGCGFSVLFFFFFLGGGGGGFKIVYGLQKIQ